MFGDSIFTKNLLRDSDEVFRGE